MLALSASSGTVARGAVLAFVYALGLGVPFLLVSFGFQVAMRTFAFFRRRARLVTRIGGAMLICVGLLEGPALVHLHGLAPSSLGQRLPAPHLNAASPPHPAPSPRPGSTCAPPQRAARASASCQSGLAKRG